jgi:hypothetical protein
VECYVGVLVAFLFGLVIGLRLPQREWCPRCKLEKEWIESTVRKFEKKHGNKPDDSDA